MPSEYARLNAIRRFASEPRSALFDLIALWRSWRARQAARRALDTLSEDLLRDIGLDRLPAGHYHDAREGLQLTQEENRRP